MTLSQLSCPRQSNSCIDIVLMIVIVRCHNTQISITDLVILTRICGLIAISQQHSAYIMNTCKCAVVIKVCIESNGLVIGRTTNILYTRLSVGSLMIVE